MCRSEPPANSGIATTSPSPLSSITTPDQQKRLYIDPRMLPLLEGRRVALIDDVISSGASIVSGLATDDGLRHRTCRHWCRDAAIRTAGARSSAAQGAQWLDRTVGVFATPILERTAEGRWRAAA